MAKLNQIIAIEKGIKARIYGNITNINKGVQKAELFNGFAKDYHKRDDNDEDLPSEKKRVQFTVTDMLREVERDMTELMDITARKDWTNCHAHADIKVDDQVILAKVPVTYLLFLEKHLTDMRTLVGNLPVLDAGEEWTFDQNSGLSRTAAIQTHRTKKVQEPLVLIQPTPEHPGQAQLITKDIIAGFWHLVKYSGAMKTPAKQKLADKVEKLLQAVKQAREEANGRDETTTPAIGGPIFAYLLGE